MSYEVYGPYISVVMLITFIGLFIWAFLPGNKKGFDSAANIPFEEDKAHSKGKVVETLDDDRRETP